MKILFGLLSLAVAVSTLSAQNRKTSADDFKPAKIAKLILPDFPLTLYQTYRNGGTASVIIALDEQGKLVESLVVGCTHHRFAELALEALQQWKFEPAQWNGAPTEVTIPITFNFEVKGVVITTDWTDSVSWSFNSMLGDADALRLSALNELDRPPVPLRPVAPSYPKSLADQGTFGDVTVEFFIDEKGAVRMPSVIGLPSKKLADLAVNAVRQWTFETPTRRGRPTLVRVQQTFSFNPHSTKG
jgi:TonB family protein